MGHVQPDKIPVDFGATAVTGIHALCVERLRGFYGLEKRNVKIIEPYQMLGQVEDDLKEAMGVTVDGFMGIGTTFGFSLNDFKPYKTLWGQEVLVPGGFNTQPDGKGGEVIFPQGDTGVEPCARMPESGYFFDSIIRQEPFEEDDLNPQDNLEEFTPLLEKDITNIKNNIDESASYGRGLIANFGGTGLGDIALVPGPMLKHPKGIRDVTEWYISTVTRQDYIHKIFDEQVEIALSNLKKIYAAVGDTVQAAFICGTDFGTQLSQFCSRETFSSLYAPYYMKINGWIHENTGWKTFKHSCGAIEPLIQSMIEAGFDIINPVQCSAEGMDPQELKKKYGRDMVFWGGGVDTQKTLPFGTPEQVRNEVMRRCEIFAKDGGFVFAAIHNIQADTPVENVAAMVEAVREFNR